MDDRGRQCTLLVYIDDATSRLMLMRFVNSETAFDYFKATRSYLETYGKAPQPGDMNFPTYRQAQSPDPFL